MKHAGCNKPVPKSASRTRKYGPNSIKPGKHGGHAGNYGQPGNSNGYSGMPLPGGKAGKK